MNREYIKQILADQMDMYLNNPIVKREYTLEDNANYCFTGIRRTGKSYMLYQQIESLRQSGAKNNQIIYVNFEDERLLEISADDLNTILEIGLELSGSTKPYLFLDEIQNVNGWEKFVRRIADMKYHISITGSNSKMLSNEIASTLGGRFLIKNIYPYSFSEYLRACGNENDYSSTDTISTRDRAAILSMFSAYLRFGAFPELVNIKNKREFLGSIYQTVYIGDIITRNRITNDFAVRLMLKKIAESVMKPLSYTRLVNILKSAGASVGKQTVINYTDYMKDSYLLFTVQNYAAKLVDKETSPKYYFMDTGLLGLSLMDCESAQLENLVAVELIRRYGTENVYYFENSSAEIDFYVPDKKLAIQVCLKILDDIDTMKRETGAFVKLHNFIPDAECIIITNSEESETECDGVKIRIIPAWKWLLNRQNR